MAIKFTDKEPEKGPDKPASRVAPPPPAPKPEAAEPPASETQLPFAKAPRPEKKRRGK